jgi:hypothetical protein
MCPHAPTLPAMPAYTASSITTEPFTTESVTRRAAALRPAKESSAAVPCPLQCVSSARRAATSTVSRLRRRMPRLRRDEGSRRTRRNGRSASTVHRALLAGLARRSTAKPPAHRCDKAAHVAGRRPAARPIGGPARPGPARPGQTRPGRSKAVRGPKAVRGLQGEGEGHGGMVQRDEVG